VRIGEPMIHNINPVYALTEPSSKQNNHGINIILMLFYILSLGSSYIHKHLSWFIQHIIHWKHHRFRTTTHILAYATEVEDVNSLDRRPVSLRWDTDSYPIKVDNCCTKSMSFDIRDFDPQSLREVHNHRISGTVMGSGTHIQKQGTIVWNILDDQGIPREIRIPNSFYAPGTASRLLSPQHWAQELDDNYPL
jgi:hypothetical protein